MNLGEATRQYQIALEHERSIRFDPGAMSGWEPEYDDAVVLVRAAQAEMFRQWCEHR
jgi:hypothetical protein